MLILLKNYILDVANTVSTRPRQVTLPRGQVCNKSHLSRVQEIFKIISYHIISYHIILVIKKKKGILIQFILKISIQSVSAAAVEQVNESELCTIGLPAILICVHTEGDLGLSRVKKSSI